MATEQKVKRVLWTADEAAEALGLTAYAVRQLAREGKIPHLKIGRRVRFRPESIERWAAGLEEETTEERRRRREEGDEEAAPAE